MSRVGFETTTPAFERAKRVHALDRATTVIGSQSIDYSKNLRRNFLTIHSSAFQVATLREVSIIKFRVYVTSLPFQSVVFRSVKVAVWHV
jgi:hypothetical protein